MQGVFFDKMRVYFGSLNQGHVDGANAIGLASSNLPLKHRAYMLATAWHETAHTLQPIEEYGKGAGRAYGAPDGPWHRVYDGRGDVQLTWLRNYVLANSKLHALGILKPDEDLAKNPELALRQDIAAAIMVHGMEEGWFTGKKLADFTDYLNMRRIINGTDKADLIAQYAIKFEDCLKADAAAVIVATEPHDAPKPEPLPLPPVAHKPQPASLLQIIINILTILFKRK
jgi:hypothetical protein